MLLYQLLQDPIQLLLTIPAILIALTFHEWAHGYAAYKCGDNTAHDMGRLSLNPLHHLDPYGSLMMLVFGFGWAKPVPVVTRNFKHPRRDFAIVAAAGPLMNMLLAFGGMLISTLVFFTCYEPIMAYMAEAGGFVGSLAFYAYRFFTLFSYLNIGLGVFNLIPLPPLDGSRIVSWLLPPKAAMYYNRIELYSRQIMLAIIILTWLPAPLSKIADYIFYPVDWLRETVFYGFANFWDAIFGAIWKL